MVRFIELIDSPYPFLLHVSYDGTFYHGSAYQPNERTVHGVLYEVLKKLNVVSDVSNLDFISRTDRGVNALHNIVIINGNRIPTLSSINMILSNFGDCFVWALSRIPRSYKITVEKKIYEYYLPFFLIPSSFGNQEDIFESISDRVTFFEGKHDFSLFIKKDKYPRSTIHEIFVAKVSKAFNNTALRFYFEGDGFGWEQIRRMIGFLIDKRWKSISPAKFLDVKNGLNPLPIKPVPGDFLVLKEISLNPSIYELNTYYSDIFKGFDRFKKKQFLLYFRWFLRNFWWKKSRYFLD